MIVLTLNSGSSSLKFGLYRVEGAETEALMTGETDGTELQAEDAKGSALPGTPIKAETPEATLQAIASLLAKTSLSAPEAIGHRIVHGGPKLRVHCVIDDRGERDLEAASAMSPLHAPAALAIIRLAKQTWQDVPQVACLDTAFHAEMPDIARILPIAKELQLEGIQRYGFHGLSCESIVHQFGNALPKRLVIAHLGSGASVTAVQDGRSIDTSMGLTPSGGIIMATRSGDIDPGVLIYLMREKKYDAAALEDLVDHRSGLFGISGVSGDLRKLHEAEPSNPDARLAVAMFCMSVAKEIAGMIVALGGVDTIVFTGGIGEHDAVARAGICHALRCFGVCLDDAANRTKTGHIDRSDSACELRVLTSREDEQIARHVGALLRR
ncbi:acetate/propionate family kinase [Sphingomonas sp. 3P27F8]|uniref:acetate/propionate family kinase n=1 Tax=Sphingomonas sp. 3P27F8 TaxID=2502213 RepID=UPI0010F4EEDB|nr:acetate/propionate family kinase [Sphingomonas sp. 3P27F8]